MRVLPILFSAPMVQALLAGRKTQTRRYPHIEIPADVIDFQLVATDKLGRKVYEMRDKRGSAVYVPAGKGLQTPHFSPRFAVGDVLYCREEFSGPSYFMPGLTPPSMWPPKLTAIWYWANGSPKSGDWGKMKPGMHMPRWASRLTLEITGVRVERLRSISERDAEAEGIEWETADPPFCYVPGIWPHSITGVGVEESRTPFSESYFRLWDYINGLGEAIRNPWVIAYTFTVHNINVDEYLKGESR